MPDAKKKWQGLAYEVYITGKGVEVSPSKITLTLKSITIYNKITTLRIGTVKHF